MANPSPTVKQPPKAHQFQPGNPGRPKGSRNKLAETFFSALCADFEKHGLAAIEGARNESPLGYLNVIARVLPQKIEVEKLAEKATDDELLAIIRQAPAVAQAAKRPNVDVEGRA